MRGSESRGRGSSTGRPRTGACTQQPHTRTGSLSPGVGSSSSSRETPLRSSPGTAGPPGSCGEFSPGPKGLSGGTSAPQAGLQSCLRLPTSRMRSRRSSCVPKPLLGARWVTDHNAGTCAWERPTAVGWPTWSGFAILPKFCVLAHVDAPLMDARLAAHGLLGV